MRTIGYAPSGILGEEEELKEPQKHDKVLRLHREDQHECHWPIGEEETKGCQKAEVGSRGTYRHGGGIRRQKYRCHACSDPTEEIVEEKALRTPVELQV